MNEEIRFCKDCLHFRPNPRVPELTKYGKCVHPTNGRSADYLVAGEENDMLEDAMFASSMRTGRCGLSGKLWEPMVILDTTPTEPWWQVLIL